MHTLPVKQLYEQTHPGFPCAMPEDPAKVLALSQEIRQLALEKQAVILAHNYQVGAVQDVADHVGDSLALAVAAQKSTARRIVFAGVHFMAEAAKILNPDKRVFLPHLGAGCSLADSISAESLEDWKARYPNHTVVTYINSSAEVKALSDICCTSANAISVVRAQTNPNILFTPDKNLGHWVKKHVPEKNIVVYDGACPSHDVLRGVNVQKTLAQNPGAVVIAHPECREDILAMADEICSTAAMLDKPGKYPHTKTFLVATESGMLHQMKKAWPDREFVMADGCIGCRLHCPYMKMIGLEEIRRSLLEEVFEVQVPEDVAQGARQALERMMAVPRD